MPRTSGASRSCGRLFRPGPKVRSKIPALDRPLCSVLDADSQLGATSSACAGNDTPYPGTIVTDQACELGGSHALGQTVGKVHTPSVVSKATLSSVFDVASEATLGDLGGMEDAWPQRSAFRDDVNSHRQTNNMTRQDVALELGATDLGLKALMYDVRRRPSLDLLKRAAALFHQPLSRYIDDLSTPVAGVSVAEAPEDIRVMLRAMMADLQRLTPDQRRIVFEIWSTTARGFVSSGK